jgi:hypothetical protein
MNQILVFRQAPLAAVLALEAAGAIAPSPRPSPHRMRRGWPLGRVRGSGERRR